MVGEESREGSMGKKHPRMTTLQGFPILSTPPNIILLWFINLLHLLSHLHHACKSFNGYVYHL
jgi:hypothetical protein